jgi:hypothetical protein
MSDEIDPKHAQKRGCLRVVGILLLTAGAICLIVGTAEFFISTGNWEGPKLFWLNFVGVPLLFVGIVMTAAGFSGAAARYSAGETAPVAKDTFNYLAEGTKDGVETLATAVGRGIGAAISPDQHPRTVTKILCPKCNHANEQQAKFCSDCGFSLRKTKACPNCGELNDPDAKFCDNCGEGCD